MRRGRERTILAWGRGLAAVPLALAALALGDPAGAGAATICVEVSSPSCDSTQTTIPKAFEAAANSPADDRVVIGPGRFEGPFSYLAPGGSGRIEVVGQGPGTVLTAPSGTTEETVLTVLGDAQLQGSVVSSLTVRIPSNTNDQGDTGIRTGSVSNVRVASDAGEPETQERSGIVLAEPGGAMRNSVVELVDGSEGDTGVTTEGTNHGSPTAIEDSRIVAPLGIFASVHPVSVVRDRITAGRSGVLACNSPVTVEDTLVRVVESGTGLIAEGSNQCSMDQGSIEARQVTIVGAGPSSNSTGVAADTGNDGQSPRVDVLLSIVRNVTTAFRAAAGVSGSSATITVGASDFEAARVSKTESAGGTASFSETHPNIDADPLFVSDLLGEFGLRAGSPAIDSAFSPPLAAGESTTDLAGSPRVLDGNGDGLAARDMGAYEAAAVPVPPDTTPPDTHIVKPKRKKGNGKLVAGPHGYALSVAFTSTEAGSRFECRLDAGHFAACTSPYRKHLTAGLHRFEVRAVDAAGNADPSPARENFRIHKAPVKKRHVKHH